MVDEGGEKVVGKRAGPRAADTTVPTGSYLTSEGSSVETDADLATEEEIPPTEEILREAEEARRKRRLPGERPSIAHAPPVGPPAEKPAVPHDKRPTKRPKR